MEAVRSFYGVSDKNVVFLYLGALAQGNSECVSACLDFMCENLKVENCLEYLKFGSKHDCEKLLVSGMFFVLENINEVGQLPGFFELENELVTRLITSTVVTLEDVSNSYSATDLLKYLHLWMEFEREKRAQVFINIAKKFPLSLVESRVLKRIVREDEDVSQDQDLRLKYFLAIEEQHFAEDNKDLEPGNQSRDTDSGVDNSGTSDSGNAEHEELANQSVEKSKDTKPKETGLKILENQQLLEKVSDEPKSAMDTEPLNLEGQQRAENISESKVAMDTKPQILENQQMTSVSEPNKVVIETETTQILENQNVEMIIEPEAAKATTKVEISEKQQSRTNIESPGTSKESSSTATNFNSRKRSIEESEVEYLGTHERKRVVMDRRHQLTITVPSSPPPPLGSPTRQLPTPGVYFIAGPAKSRFLYFLNPADLEVSPISPYPSTQDFVQTLFYHPRAALLGVAFNERSKHVNFPELRLYDLRKKEWRMGGHLLDETGSAGQIWKWFAQGDHVYFLTADSVQRLHIANVDMTDCSILDCVYRSPKGKKNSRIGFSGAEVGNKFYMIGGRSSDKDGSYLNIKVVMYDPDTFAWKRMADMPTGRMHPTVAVLESKLYVLGGGGVIKGEMLSSCEVYDPESDMWTPIAPLHQPRMKAGAFVLNGRIHVLGGNEGDPTLERYDPGQNTWTVFETTNFPWAGYKPFCSGFYHNSVQILD